LGSGGIAPRILNLDTRWRRVVSFKPRSLYHPGKIPRYLLGRSLHGHQSWTERGGEDKWSYHFPCREWNRGRPARSLVTTLA